MPRVCKICTHDQREAIERALVNGTPLRDIAGQFGISRSALDRHKENHLAAGVVKAKAAEEVAHADSVLDQIRVICERTERLYQVSEGILSKAYKANDLRTALGAVREANSCNKEARNNMELLAELTKELDRNTTVNVLVAPEWAAVQSALYEALRPYPDARVAVAERLTVLEVGR